MGSGEEKIDVDPYYKKNNAVLRSISKKNDEDGEVNWDEVRNILKREFDKELNIRQKQLEEIEEKLTKAQKLLHIVRYVLITSYYNKKSLEYTTNTPDETVNKVFDGQNRIHPAVKKLLGKNANLDVFSHLGKRKAVLKSCDTSEPSTSGTPVKKIKQEIDIELLNVEPKQSENKLRKKILHKIIVGNISKYMPSLEDGNTTHKWMVYVRGEKDKPNISNIVRKVKFYLHPSYKPHDIIEINESPFHLSRRGWGEFPLRVQIFFKCKLNKPIDVIHQLKLDKTCSGRQVLGNETLVDVYLHEEVVLDQILSDTEPIRQSEIELSLSIPENLESSFTPLKLSPALPKQEHDYCQEDQNKKLCLNEHDYSMPEHSYCMPYDKKIKTEEIDIDLHEVKDNNKLRFGLDESYLDNSDKKLPILKSLPIKILLPVNNKTVLTNGHLISTSTPIVIKKVLPATSSQYTIKLPQNKFKCMGEILPYVIKRMPLWSDRAKDGDFKRSFPFMATSKEEFYSWNVGKRINAEWCRARMLKKLLDLNFGRLSKKWTTKSYFMYCRSHVFSPIVSFNLFRIPSRELRLINGCFAECLDISKDSNHVPDDVNVDIESENDHMRNSRTHFVDISDPAWKPHCSFVKEAALDCGVVLKSVEITEGVIFNGAERMLLEAMKSFAENLIRRGHHHMVATKKYSRGVSTVGVSDIQMALEERAEIKLIKDFKRRRQEMYFFT